VTMGRGRDPQEDDMANQKTKTEAGHGKSSSSARWCTRLEAKTASRKARRRQDRRAAQESN